MKDNLLKFYLNKFTFLKSLDEIEISEIPPLLRRRMSNLDKITFSLLNKIYEESVQNIVFSSQYGEFDRLIKIINQYKEEKQASPNVFSASVHNYPVSFFLSYIKKEIPYNALSSGENSISCGLISAIASKYDNLIFCYSDFYKDKIEGLALNISKTPLKNSVEYQIVLENNDIKDKLDNYIKLFTGGIKILKTDFYKIERKEQ